jgi:Cu/Zn superoxide dismutase
MSARSIAACAAACCCLTAGAGVALAHGGSHPAPPATPAPALGKVRATTTTLLQPISPGGPMGVAHVTQRGAVLSGFVVVWGLEPGSRHANHVHGNAVGGPLARCTPGSRRTTRHLADLPDLVADANGVAFGVVRERVTERAVRRGVYLMVHRDPTTSGPMAPGMNPPIACGNLS